MSVKWTECNLPWHVHNSSTAPLVPNIERRMHEEFPDYLERGRLSLEERRAYSNRVNEWYNVQPEVQEWRDRFNEWDMNERSKSFVGQGLNISGTLIVIDTSEGEKVLLIGDINENGGTSSEFPEFSDTTVVKRYCKLSDAIAAIPSNIKEHISKVS